MHRDPCEHQPHPSSSVHAHTVGASTHVSTQLRRQDDLQCDVRAGNTRGSTRKTCTFEDSSCRSFGCSAAPTPACKRGVIARGVGAR
eukprot:6183726-Pleurochrysis_carterae.AAC.2